ncbi:unnamed protein product [Closterium sp. NIES-65]|nr:unnamed protein product [Closterium sp. NIES-65]
MSPVHHNHMLYNHYLQGFQLPAFQNGSWAVPSAVPSALPALSPLPLRQEGADSAAADAKAEMQRVDSSTHINSLVAQYSFAQAGAAAAAAAAAAACAGSPVSPSQLVSPRTGWPHFAACPPFMGPMGPVSYAPGFGTIRSPKPAEGSASAGGSSSSHLPSLLESPLQSEVLPAESDGESCCKIELPTEQMDGEGETEADESRRLLFPSEQPATDGGAEGAEKAEQDLRVTKGTRAMQLLLEGGAEGDVQGMGPFDWLDEPSGAEEATGLPHWVLAELGEGGAGKKSGEAVEEEVYRVLFRADSMESATSEQHVTTPLHETPLQAHEAKDEQYEDESTPTGTNKAVTGTPAGEEQGLNTVSNAGSADFGTTSIGDLVLGGLVDKPSAQVLEDSSTEDIWHDVLRQEHVEYVVAPYEADAQMAYLCTSGLVHAVITEDSDLIAYSCPRVLFKMDHMGHGDEIVYANIGQSQELALADFTPQMVLEMCILSGCDYLDSLPKVGLKTAHDWIRRHRNYQSALAVAKLNGRVVPEEYEGAFEQALLTFLHHRVYHLADELMTHVNPLPPTLGPDTDLSRFYAQYAVPFPLHPHLNNPSSPVPVDPAAKTQYQPPRGSRVTSSFEPPEEYIPTAPAAKKQFQPPRRSPVTPPVQSAFEPSRPEAAAEPGPSGSANQPGGNSSGRGGRSVRRSAAGQGSAGSTAGEGLMGAEEGSGEPMVGEDLVQFMAGTVLEEERQQQPQQEQQPVAAGPRAAVARVFQRFTPPRSIAEAGTTPEPPSQQRQPYRRAAPPRVSGDRQEGTPTEWDQFVLRGSEGARGEEERAEDGSERSEGVLRRGRDLDEEWGVNADLDADLDELLLPPAFDLVNDVPGSHEIRQVGRRPGGWRAGGWMGMRGAAGAAGGGRARGRGGGVGFGGGRVVGLGVGEAGSSRQQAEAVFDSPKRMLGSGRGVQGRGVRGRMGAAHVVVQQEMSCSTCVVSPSFLSFPPVSPAVFLTISHPSSPPGHLCSSSCR